jgi:hypothetical protein
MDSKEDLNDCYLSLFDWHRVDVREKRGNYENIVILTAALMCLSGNGWRQLLEIVCLWI